MMSHNLEDLTIKQNTPVAAPLDCQTTARQRSAWLGGRLPRLASSTRQSRARQGAGPPAATG